MTRITRFEEIRAWQMARRLTKLVYSLTRKQPFASDFGAKDEIQRASVSMMSNIAERFDSNTPRLFLSYLARAKASVGELQSHLYIAKDLRYISPTDFREAVGMVDTVARQLRKFIQHLLRLPTR